MGFLGSSASTAKQILLKKSDRDKDRASKLGRKGKHAMLLSEDYNSLNNERNDSIESFNKKFHQATLPG